LPEPGYAEFLRQAAAADLIPVCQDVVVDQETPISVYRKLGGGPGTFLLESVEGGEHLARYSFLGLEPLWILTARGEEVTGGPQGGVRRGDPLTILRQALNYYRVAPGQGLPRFWGGSVGYFGYDLSRRFLRREKKLGEHFLPDIYQMFPGVVLVFDHVRQVVTIVILQEISADPEVCYQEAQKRISRIKQKLAAPLPEERRKIEPSPLTIISQTPKETFLKGVEAVKEYISAGDAIQVVLSRRWELNLKVPPFEVYRVLRRTNPSPYMFFLDMGESALVGSSPEMQVRIEGGRMELRPIAGTRPRGATLAADLALEAELKDNGKENAEHLMLVDLARNDLGRVCRPGSVVVRQLAEVERYSHVMHLVSRVEGDLAPGHDALDALLASFPAGTVSGAPKVRALEIIDELEQLPRGPYGGVVGYWGLNGNMDTCLTIRTLVTTGSRGYVQAGAGIVADSDPQTELQETLHKARAVLLAINEAQGGVNLDLND